MLTKTYNQIKKMQETRMRNESEKYPSWLIGFDRWVNDEGLKPGLMAFRKFLKETNARQ